MSANLRIVPVRNAQYKKSGYKSYGRALAKYDIHPTTEGPFRTRLDNFRPRGDRFGRMGRALARVFTRPQAQTVAAKLPAQDVQHDAQYICEVVLGNNRQTLHLDFDTGSADLWVWSTKLPRAVLNRYQESHAVFNPTSSATWMEMEDSRWQIAYGDGSSASGRVGKDVVEVGGVVIQNQAIEYATKLSSAFAQGAGDGLLGLAFSNINTVQPRRVETPVENMITQQDIPNKLFTAYLGSYKDAAEADRGQSFYTFGFIDQPTLQACNTAEADIHWAPVNSSNGFWEFSSQKARINGNTISLGANTAIADTGTTLALVSDELCKAVYNNIPGASYDTAQQGWLFPKTTDVSKLPVVEFGVGNDFFAVQKEDLAFADAGNNMFYGGIQSRGNNPQDILGDTFLKGIYAIFDQGNKRFGAVRRTEKFQNLDVPVVQMT